MFLETNPHEADYVAHNSHMLNNIYRFYKQCINVLRIEKKTKWRIVHLETLMEYFI